MQTEKPSEKLRHVNSEQALQLKDLIHQTGVAAEIRAELFREWIVTAPMHWPEIHAKLQLLNTAEVVIGRMAEPDG